MKNAYISNKYNSEFILCACGCGKLRSKYNPQGQERKFITGHSSVKGKSKYDKTIMIECECGCGELIHKFDKKGRIQKKVDIWNKADEIINLYTLDNIPTTRIAKNFNCSYELIRRILHKRKIPIKNRGFFLKNKTYEELYGLELAEIKKNKISNNAKNNSNYGMKGKNQSQKSKFKIGKKSRLRKHSEESIRKAVETRMNNDSYKHTEIYKKMMSERFSGEKSYNWKGGITPESVKRVKDRKWQKIADYIRNRDNNTCRCCNFFGRNKLPVHHIIPYELSKCNEEYNLITLCPSCHMIYENKVKRLGYKELQDKLSKVYGYKYSEDGNVILEFKNEVK